LKENGDFLTGVDLTIADLSAFQQVSWFCIFCMMQNTTVIVNLIKLVLWKISYFTKGVADYVPKDCLDSFGGIVAWMERVKTHPKVAAYKASKQWGVCRSMQILDFDKRHSAASLHERVC
jgi:glutathione S-transferase